MSLWEALLLGLVQGLTEFLPVSSSGHLVIFQHFLGIHQTGLVFEVLVHLATLLAVLVAFWPDIWNLLRHPTDRLVGFILAGAIPTAIIGFVFEPILKPLFSSVRIVAVMLIVTGILLVVSDFYGKGKKGLGQMRLTDALLIGTVQGLAITPGISRSGSTIVAALLSGLNRDAAARYSFLLSVPVILGANIFELRDLPLGVDACLIPYLVGMLAAALSGYLAIKVFLKLLKKGKLWYFSLYCWVVALLVLIFS